MDKNRKRAVATVACFTAAIVIWIGANFTVTALTTRTVEPDQQEPQTSRTEPAPSARRAATAQPKASVERLCAATAPAALKAYVTDTADRADQLERYFTQDAAGLDIPIGRIAPQPLDQFTGFIETGDDSADTASCSVHVDTRIRIHGRERLAVHVRDGTVGRRVRHPGRRAARQPTPDCRAGRPDR